MASFNGADRDESTSDRREIKPKDYGMASSVDSSKSSIRYEGAANCSPVKEKSFVGYLWYRLSSLFLLQNLFSAAVEENRVLKSQMAKLENSHSSLKQQQYDSSRNSRTLRTTRTNHELRDEEYRSETDSLLSVSCRTLQLQLSKHETMITGLEGTNEKGLVKQNVELKERCNHQQSVMEDLERELGLYHQLESSDSATKGVASAEDSIVKRLSEYEKILTIEKTLVRELGTQLRTRDGQLEETQRQLDLERWGRHRDRVLLKELLNDLVLCCVQMPYVAKDTELKAAFEDLIRKSEPLTTEFRENISAAAEVALDDNSRDSFLRERSSAASQNILDGLTLSQAKAKIIELEDELRRLGKEAKTKVIEQMRKYKQAAMKAKDMDERLKKSDADKRLVEEQLGDELRRTRAQLDEFVLSLGYRSSYATKAAQSVRPLVELLEDQKKELQTQRDCLEREVSSLRTKLEENERDIDRLAKELSHIRTTAMEEAKDKVQHEFQKLQSECSGLREETASLKERNEQLEEAAKGEREARRSAEERAQRQESQSQQYESESSRLRANNQSLVAAKGLLEPQVSDLEQQVFRLSGSSQERVDRQSFQSGRLDSQKTPGIRYMQGKDLPRPKLLPRSSLPIRTDTTGTASLTGRETIQESSTLGSTAEGMQALYSNTSRSGLFNVPEVSGGQAALRPGATVPFSSLQGVLGESHSGSVDSGLPSSIREGSRNVLYSRSATSRSPLGRQTRDVMQCLRCGARFPVTNLDGYEKHIRDCYSDVR